MSIKKKLFAFLEWNLYVTLTMLILLIGKQTDENYGCFFRSLCSLNILITLEFENQIDLRGFSHEL